MDPHAADDAMRDPADAPPCMRRCPLAAAGLDPVDRISLLTKTAPRPAGMGGAFTAVPGDPMGLWWNPSAAMFSQRLAVSGSHSLRHFPGERRNLDQFDADLMGATIPLAGDHMLGLAMNVPGEWGVDYADTNGVLDPGCAHKCPRQQGVDGDVPCPRRQGIKGDMPCPKHKSMDGDGPCPEHEAMESGAPCPYAMPPRVRGRERRVSLGNYHNFKNSRGLGATELASNWYRKEHVNPDRIHREFQHAAGFSLYYEANNGFRYGATLRLTRRQRPDQPVNTDTLVDMTVGVAWRDDPASDTLAALDLQLLTDPRLSRGVWRYFAGVERGWDNDAFARLGLMNGLTTYGAGVRMSHLRLDYAVVRDLLPSVAGSNPGRFGDGHFLSYTLTD